jgi:hypothetical protein
VYVSLKLTCCDVKILDCMEFECVLGGHVVDIGCDWLVIEVLKFDWDF